MALFQGILADIYPAPEGIPVWQRRTRHFNCQGTKECRHGEEGAEKETFTAIKEIRRVCKKSGFSMAEIAIIWIMENPAITCSLAGSRNVSELKANVKAVNTI